MSKQSFYYICTECENTTGKWGGRCLSCSAWGTLVKKSASVDSPLERKLQKAESVSTTLFTEIQEDSLVRIKTDDNEIDRCLGGGLVAGSVILLGGDPGVGKSTLALQLAAKLENKQAQTLYVCGEESLSQIKMRAKRLKGEFDQLQLVSATNLSRVLATLKSEQPTLAIIDSIQTLYDPEITSSPGSVTQVSNAAARLVELAKQQNTSLLLIGHVTKDGFLAGPKTLEHAVDTVLYLEGERFQNLRILRAVKNRFGAVNEIGVFEMTSHGLQTVSNPSKLFIGETFKKPPAGVAFTAIFEGSRVLVVEIQSLLSKSSLAYPKRTVVGFEQNRLGLLLAVLAKFGKIPVLNQDVYLNIAGGLKVNDPACDLGILSALMSGFLDKTLPPGTAVLGEVGLAGEIRSISALDQRLKELERLGFESVILPQSSNELKTGLKIKKVASIADFVKLFGKK